MCWREMFFIYHLKSIDFQWLCKCTETFDGALSHFFRHPQHKSRAKAYIEHSLKKINHCAKNI